MSARAAAPRNHPLDLETTLRLLRKQGLLTTQQCARIRAALGSDDERHPLTRIAELGMRGGADERASLTPETLTRALANAAGLDYFRIDPLKINVEAVTALVSQAYATRFGFLPVAVHDDEVVIASAEPFVTTWHDELERVLKRPIRHVLANPHDIQRYLREFYGVSRSISGATHKTGQDAGSRVTNFEQLTELGTVGEPDANDRHIVHLVDWLLQYAFEQRASDIHIEPRRDQGNIRFRIDGVLHLIHQLPRSVMTAITSRIKSLGRMDVADKRRPQDGRIRTRTPTGQEIELRLSTMPTTFGEKLVLRIFDPEKLSQAFEDLGFETHELELWNDIVARPHGIILVTGPTGSGKTTTLYAALKRLARPEINVCTIEDPIEMVEPAFNQMQVQPALDIDFASGVRTLLRQDPDIIMVGEIRDRETADVAVQAALTGHLVLSTLHTNDAPSAVTRLVDIGVQPFLIGATLLGVLAQRLVRTLCPGCKRPGAAPAAAWTALVADTPLAAPSEFQRPVGCDECRHTGFRGRQGIYELMRVDEALGQLITADLQTATLRRAALARGMRSLRTTGALKVAHGWTTVEEIVGVVPPADSSQAARPCGNS